MSNSGQFLLALNQSPYEEILNNYKQLPMEIQNMQQAAAGEIRKAIDAYIMVKKVNPSDEVIATIKNKFTPKPQNLLSSYSVPFLTPYKPCVPLASFYSKNPVTASGTSSTIQISYNGDFMSDLCLHLVITPPQVMVTAGTAEADTPYLRVCDYPGERVLKRVQFVSDGSTIDRYNNNAMVFNRNLRVKEDSMAGYKRIIGQQTTRRAKLIQGGLMSPGSEVFVDYADGPQSAVPIGSMKSLELFIPLQFWFCESISRAIPISIVSSSIVKSIMVDYANSQEIFNLVPRGSGTYETPNAYISETVLRIESSTLYVSTITVDPSVVQLYAALGINMVLASLNFEEIKTDAGQSNIHKVTSFKAPIEYFVLGFRPSSYNSTSEIDMRKSMSKWHKFHYAEDSVKKLPGTRVTRLKYYPAIISKVGSVYTIDGSPDIVGRLEAKYAGNSEALSALAQLRASGGYSANVPSIPEGSTIAIGDARIQLYGEMDAIINGAVTTTVVINGEVVGLDAVDLLAQVFEEEMTVVAEADESMILALSAKCAQNDMYQRNTTTFYNSYLPYIGSHNGNLVTPKDKGVLYVPFTVNPNTYHPGGHINLVRTSDIQFDWEMSKSIPAGLSTELVVYGKASNFLTISRAGYQLRFTA